MPTPGQRRPVATAIPKKTAEYRGCMRPADFYSVSIPTDAPMSQPALTSTDRPRLRAGVWTLLVSNSEPSFAPAKQTKLNQTPTFHFEKNQVSRAPLDPEIERNVQAPGRKRGEIIVTSVANFAPMTIPAQAEIRLARAQATQSSLFYPSHLGESACVRAV